MRLLSSLGTLLGSLLGLLGPSSGVSRAKKCRQSHAKSTFSKVFLLVSRSPFWFSWAPLGLSRARLGAQMAPKRGPKGSLKWVQNGSKNGSVFGALSGPFRGPFWGPKRVPPGVTFSTFFYQKLQFRKGHSAIFDISKNAFFCVFFAFKSQKMQFRKGHSAIFAFPENVIFY